MIMIFDAVVVLVIVIDTVIAVIADVTITYTW